MVSRIGSSQDFRIFSRMVSLIMEGGSLRRLGLESGSPGGAALAMARQVVSKTQSIRIFPPIVISFHVEELDRQKKWNKKSSKKTF